MYTAVVINKADRKLLIDELHSLPDWWAFNLEPYPYRHEIPSGELPHHVTLNLGRFEDGPNDPSLLGETVEIIVDAFCWDHALGVCAARVLKMETKQTAQLQSSNAQPHITMCVAFGTKPYESNNLDWRNAFVLKTPLIVSGVVEEC